MIEPWLSNIYVMFQTIWYWCKLHFDIIGLPCSVYPTYLIICIKLISVNHFDIHFNLLQRSMRKIISMVFKEKTSEEFLEWVNTLHPREGARRWPFSPFLSDWCVLGHFVSGITQDKNRARCFILDIKDLGRWVFELLDRWRKIFFYSFVYNGIL